MKLLTLKQCSRPVDENCVVFCDRQASLLMKCANSQLVRVIEPDGELHFVWHNKATSFNAPEFTRVFFMEDDGPIVAFEDVHIVEPDEVFCYDGFAYCLTQNTAKTLSIRQIDVFCSQRVLEQVSYYDFLPEKVDEIYMVKLYRLEQSKEFAYAAWVMERESTRFHIPVFDKDGADLDDLLESSLYIEERMQVGETFAQHGRSFELMCDSEQKLCLADGLRLNRNFCENKRPNTLKAKCIPLRK